MRSCLFKLSSACLLGLSLQLNAADALEDAANLQQLGEKNRADVIVLMVSQDNCRYCVRVKRDYLEPLLASGEHPPIRILHIDRTDSIIDFDGEKRDASIIASRLGGRFTPTLLFVDSRGEQIHPPIIGLNTPDYYGFYVDDAIRKARQQIN